jgi:hypothetical protein
MEIEGLNKIDSLSFCFLISFLHFCVLIEVAVWLWGSEFMGFNMY